MKKLIVVLVALAMCVSTASAGLVMNPHPGYGRGMYLQAAAAPQQVTWQGNTVWEYVYDLFVSEYPGRGANDIYDFFLKFDGGDAGALVGLYNGKQVQNWSSYSAGKIPAPYWWWSAPPSVPTPEYVDLDDQDGDGITDEWFPTPLPTTASAQQWSYDAGLDAWSQANGVTNAWHAPSDYIDAADDGGDFQQGVIFDDSATDPWGGAGWAPVDGIYFAGNDEMNSNTVLPTLSFTVRMLSTQGPGGLVELYYDEYYSSYNFGGSAVGPIPEPATMSLLAFGGIAALIRRRK